MLGPIDTGRSVYNQIIGDTPALKRQLLDYSRQGIQEMDRNITPQETERKLARELEYKLGADEKIDPLKVSTEKLLDSSEEYAKSFYHRWVWPSLE